jgi:beta-galactosidase/beta-glucuronidase
MEETMCIPKKHPRPDFARTNFWKSLNGRWDFKPDPDDEGVSQGWHIPGRLSFDQKILVPFAWETPNSGINQQWLPVGWYQTKISPPQSWQSLHTVLHIGAAHYRCQGWLNSKFLGEHLGGYLPFEFDLTAALVKGEGDLILRVEAPIDKRYIPHGKQRSLPEDDYDDCAFTASSGIWQSVWMEGRPPTYIQSLTLRPDKNLKGIDAQVHLDGPHAGQAQVSLIVANEKPQILKADGKNVLSVHLPISEPRKWHPNDPHLYDVKVELESPDGIDLIHSYTGLRRFEVQRDRFYLNGEQIYLRGALDQGYWPDSGYTAPDDSALRRDIELALSTGYNLIRKHIKLEDPRWLYWADQLGMLVWEEPPNVGRYAKESIAAFEAQLGPMVERDCNHPCIILWGLYNEEWGLDWRLAEDAEKQADVAHAYDRLSALDHSRPIIDNSGWWHVKTDVLDWHYYDEDMHGWMETSASLASNSDSAYAHRLSDIRSYETKLWVPGYQRPNLPLINSEYGGGKPHKQGWLFRWQTQDLHRRAVFNGYIYTELYDVEYEKVGIYTATRQLKDLGCDPKMVNAETVLCFDMVPVSPGLDYLAKDRKVKVNLLVAHHGKKLISGKLRWEWITDPNEPRTFPVQVQPFEIRHLLTIETTLPADLDQAQLLVRLIDEHEKVLATNFLDIGLDNFHE